MRVVNEARKRGFVTRRSPSITLPSSGTATGAPPESLTSNHVHLLVNDTGPNGNVTQAKARVALWFTRDVSAGDEL